jgi:hypothetical protein
MPGDAIEAFWSWWPTVREDFARAFSTREPLDPALIEAMTAHVKAIHESLDWEFGRGTNSAHHLCVSGTGDPALRVIAERWWKRAPAADANWEFHPCRQAGPAEGVSLKIAGHEVAFDEMTFTVNEDEAREVIHVEAHHPQFEVIADDALRMQVVFLALDQLLGEDGVERWIGSVGALGVRPAEATSYAGLRDRIDALAKRATRERWAILRAESDGKPIFVAANLALKRIDNLLFDMHAVITLNFEGADAQGLPTRDEADALNAIEDELLQSLGAHAVFVGRETTDGRRELHFRVMESGPWSAIVDRWIQRHPARHPALEVAMDPRWERRKW